MKDEIEKACDALIENPSNTGTRYLYDWLCDYMYETECHGGGMFESYGVILDFKNIETNIVKVFRLAHLEVIVKTLRTSGMVFTPLALVLATYIELRMYK